MIRPGSGPVREGDLLAGKYRVERVLGAGGMGIVVAARHVELDQLVAIKFVREEALDNEQGIQRFLREARAAVKLKSEHVARVLDVGKLESGAPYMVMEYLEGSDLAKVLAERGPLPLDSAADWIMQACEAVAEAHAAGIVHRDLKPENLFLTRSVGGAPKVKVLDFGVSKALQGSSGGLSNLTRTRAMLGSPLYMSPEQMRSSRDVNSRADIWALGVVLFQLLTTRWPFEADTMPELCLKVVSDPPLSLAALRPDVPPAMVAVVERCLSKDPAKRFAEAAELASALEPFAHPASRLLAERARLAMASSPGSMGTAPAHPSASWEGAVPAVPGSTQVSGSSSERQAQRLPDGSGDGLGPNTPGTSAAWGAALRGGTPAPEARRGRGAAMLVGACAIGAAASVVVGFALRRSPADAATATATASGEERRHVETVSSSVAPGKPPFSTAPFAEGAMAAPAPVPIAPSASTPGAASAPALAPPRPATSLANGAVVRAAREASAPPPARVVAPPPPRPAQDEDIPTIR